MKEDKKCRIIVNDSNELLNEEVKKKPSEEVIRPGLLHSLSVPGAEGPYHKLRRASHVIISGKQVLEMTLEWLRIRILCF